MSKILFADMIKNKNLKDFTELKSKRVDERVCPNCGEIEQDPLYDSVCGLCGHLK